jgi:hypothetical protein
MLGTFELDNYTHPVAIMMFVLFAFVMGQSMNTRTPALQSQRLSLPRQRGAHIPMCVSLSSTTIIGYTDCASRVPRRSPRATQSADSYDERLLQRREAAVVERGRETPRWYDNVLVAYHLRRLHTVVPIIRLRNWPKRVELNSQFGPRQSWTRLLQQALVCITVAKYK